MVMLHKEVEHADGTVTVVTTSDAREVFGATRWQLNTQITEDCRVSTVFLGLDHGFGFGSEPLFYETMIFGAEDFTVLDGDDEWDHLEYQQRYPTREAAKVGHQVAVDWALARLPAAPEGTERYDQTDAQYTKRLKNHDEH